MIRKALVRKISLFGLTALMVGAMLIGCGSGADDKALTTNEASADAEEATAAVEAQTEEEEQSKDNAITSEPVSSDGSDPFDTEAETDEEGNSDALDKSGVYSDKELCDMALDYYEKENGYRPGMAEVEDREVHIVLIRLYDDMGDHIATSAWYEIDSRTGKGKDTIFGDKVDLTK